MPETWTVLAVLDWTTKKFAERGIEAARLEAQVLIAHALRCSRVQLYTGFDKPLGDAELATIRELIKRRLAGEPLAYLVGDQEFWSLPFAVDRNVLVPRHDTETLVELVLATYPDRGVALRGVDVGTGSGAIAITLARELRASRWLAIDLSPAAAEIDALLPGLVTMTDDDRRHSDGKLRDGEADALASVLDVADRYPQYFTVLADKDGGVDPRTFETALLRDHIARRKIFAALADTADALATPLTDTVLTLGEQVRPVLLAAYQIAKPIAGADDKVRSALAPALDFYGRIGRRSAETRTKKAAPTAAK